MKFPALRLPAHPWPTCPDCGLHQIDVAAWIDARTGEDTGNDSPISDPYHCPGCDGDPFGVAAEQVKGGPILNLWGKPIEIDPDQRASSRENLNLAPGEKCRPGCPCPELRDPQRKD